MKKSNVIDELTRRVTQSADTLPKELPEPARTILAIERLTWRYAGYKEQVIRELLGLSPTAYHQKWNRMIDDPAIEQADPHTVRRWKRLRESRQSTRRARKLDHV